MKVPGCKMAGLQEVLCSNQRNIFFSKYSSSEPLRSGSSVVNNTLDSHLYGKQLFTWLSLVVFLMASFVLSFFPLDILDEIWDLIESVSEGFLTYSSNPGFARLIPRFSDLWNETLNRGPVSE